MLVPNGEVLTGPVLRRNGTSVGSITTGADANAYILSTPPTQAFVNGAPAAVVRTAVPSLYVRAYTEGVTNPVGGFVAPINTSRRGLTEQQIRDVLALPFLPTSLDLGRGACGDLCPLRAGGTHCRQLWRQSAGHSDPGPVGTRGRTAGSPDRTCRPNPAAPIRASCRQQTSPVARQSAASRWPTDPTPARATPLPSHRPSMSAAFPRSSPTWTASTTASRYPELQFAVGSADGAEATRWRSLCRLWLHAHGGCPSVPRRDAPAAA